MAFPGEYGDDLHGRLFRFSSLPNTIKWSFVGAMHDSFLECHKEESIFNMLRVFESHHSRELPFELSFFPIEVKPQSLSIACLWGVLVTFESTSHRDQLDRQDWYGLIKKDFPELPPVPHLSLSCFIHNASLSVCYFTVCSADGALSCDEQKTYKRKLTQSLKGCLSQKRTPVLSSFGEESFIKQLIYSLKKEVHPDDAFPEVMTAFDRKKGPLLCYRVGIAWVVRKDNSPKALFNTINAGFPLTCRLEKIRARTSEEEKCAVGSLDLLVELSPAEYRFFGEGQSDVERGYHYVKNQLKSILGKYRDYTGSINTFRLTCYRNFCAAVEDYAAFQDRPVNAAFTREFFYSIASIDHFAMLHNQMALLYLIYQNLIQQPKLAFDQYLHLSNESSNSLVIGAVTDDSTFKRLLQDKLTPLFSDEDIIPCYVSLDHAHCCFFGIIVIDKSAFSAVKNAFSEGLQLWQERERKRQVLRLNCDHSPEAIVPASGSGRFDYVFQHLLFDGLMQFDIKGNAVKALAKKIKISHDRTRYQFTLRKAHWSNGKPITAADFVFSWQQTLATTPPYSDLETMRVIKNARLFLEKKIGVEQIGVRALDPFILEVELEHPVVYFLELLAIPLYFVIPQNKDQQDPLWYYDKQGISSGPFQLENSIADRELRLVKNPHYWNASAIKLEQVLISKEKNSSRVFDRFAKGDLHSIGMPMSLSASPSFLREHASCQPSLTPLLYHYQLNVRQFPFNNLKIRQALSFSLNRDQLIAPFSKEYQLTPSFSPIPHLCPEKSPIRSREEVKKLWKEGLAELDYVSASPIPCKIGYSDRNKFAELLAQQIKNQWENDFSLEVQLCPVGLGKMHYSRSSQLSCLIKGYFSIIKHPLCHLSQYCHQENWLNSLGWTHSIYREMISRAYEENDAKGCQQLCKEAATLLVSNAAIVPLCQCSTSPFLSTQLENVGCSGFNFGFRFASIKQNKRKK